MIYDDTLTDRPVLDALGRIADSMSKTFICTCGNRWRGSTLTPHVCPECESDEVSEVAA